MKSKSVFGLNIKRFNYICYPLLLTILAIFWLSDTTLAGGIPDGPNVQITDAGLGDDPATLPDLAVRGETVYAVWDDGRPNPFDADLVYFAKSTDGGKTWGPNIQVNELPYDDWTNEPQISVNSDGLIFVLWHTFYKDDSDKINDLRLALSDNDGESFSVLTLVDGFDDSADLRFPKLASDPSNGRTYFLFTDYRNLDGDEGYNFEFLAINSDGTSAVSRKDINDAARTGRGTFPLVGGHDNMPFMDIAVHNGMVCAAWEDKRERTSIFGTCSQDGGETFSANFNISGADGIEPQIALAPDGSLYAIYAHDSDQDSNIRLRRSPDLGSTWDEEQIVTDNIEVDDVQNWEIEVDDNNQIVIAWADDYGASGDIILSTSLDQGVTFGHQRIDDDPEQNADTFNVSLAVAGSGTDTRAYVAWRDDRIDFDDKIWFQPIILDGIGPTVPANPQAVGEDNSILLTWNASTDSTGIAGYRVYRSASAAGPFEEIAPRGAYSTFFRDVELTNGETYFYQIAAIDGTGNTGVRTDAVSASAQIGQGLTMDGTIAYVEGDNIQLRDLPAIDNGRVPSQGDKPYFSPDGTRLYYYTSNTVSSKLIAGGGDQIHLQNTEFYGEYDISNDGVKIGAIVGDNFPTADGTLCFVTEPTYFDMALPRFIDEFNRSFHIAISSTGTWLAYDYTGFCNVAAFGITSPPSFCIVNTVTSEKKCIEGADFEAPDFAPSGSRIAIATKDSGQNEIWTAEMQDDGTLANYIQITRGPTNKPSTEPAFSSDGQWIIFQRDMDTSEDEAFQLYVVKADGSGLRPLNLTGVNAAWHNGEVGAPPNPDPNPTSANLSPSIFLPLVNG